MRRDLEDWLRGKANLPTAAEPPLNVLEMNLPVVLREPSSPVSPSVALPPPQEDLQEAGLASPETESVLPHEATPDEQELLPLDFPEEEPFSVPDAAARLDAQVEDRLLEDFFLYEPSTEALFQNENEEMSGFFEEETAYLSALEETVRARYARRNEEKSEERNHEKKRPNGERQMEKNAPPPHEFPALRLTEQLRNLVQMKRAVSEGGGRFGRRRRLAILCVVLILVGGTLFAVYRSGMRDTYASRMQDAESLYRQERYAESLELYRQASIRYPEKSEPLLRVAHASERVGHLDAAIDAYRQALALFPAEDALSRSKIFYEIGRLYSVLKLWEEAQRHFEQAIGADAASYSAYFALGSVLEERKIMNEAAKAYKNALDLSPSSDAARDAIKRVSFYLPAQETDFAAFEAEKKEKARAAANVALGLKRYDKASQYFAEVLALDSADAGDWVGFAEARRGLGDVKGALTSLRRALERDPAHAEAKARLDALMGSPKTTPVKKPAGKKTSFEPLRLNPEHFKKASRNDRHLLAVPVGGTKDWVSARN